jgi:hypothetical protein
MRYRKKPIVIEAIELTEANRDEVAFWCGGRWVEAPLRPRNNMEDYATGLYIGTLEGGIHASIGDFVIRGVKGEFYPCKPDIFAATYEAVGLVTDAPELIPRLRFRTAAELCSDMNVTDDE